MNATLTPARESNSPRFLLFLICLFASAGQLAIDIYVPALPDMARSFATTPQAIQSSVSGYMAAYALGQLIFGPVADAYGRKRVLAFAVIYTIGCLLSLGAQNLETFVLARCLQGFGIATTNLLAKAIITDSFAGQADARVYVHVDRVGACADRRTGDRRAPAGMVRLARVPRVPARVLAGDVGAAVALPRNLAETRASRAAHADDERGQGAGGRCSRAASSHRGCATASCSCSTSSGRSWCRPRCTPPTFFGYLALGIGLMYFLGGLSNRIHRPGLPSAEQRLRIGARVMAGASVAMLVLALTVGLRVWTLATPVLVMGFCAGAMYPTLMAKGNSLFPHIAGLTSAILGCALLLVSSAMMGLAGFVSIHVLTPLAVFFVVLSCIVVWMVTKLLRYLSQQQAQAAPSRAAAKRPRKCRLSTGPWRSC